MKGSKVEGFQAAGKALAVADDPMAVQWKGRAAQIATWQWDILAILGYQGRSSDDRLCPKMEGLATQKWSFP